VSLRTSVRRDLVWGLMRCRGSGKDGSRQFKAKVDANADGKAFVPAEITKNGELVR
jgi:hypothetical protein